MLLSWQHSDADGDGHRQHFGGKMEQYYCLGQIYGKNRWIHQHSVLKMGEYYMVQDIALFFILPLEPSEFFVLQLAVFCIFLYFATQS